MEHNVALGELVIRGQGDTHLRVMIERLESRFKLHVEAREPGVPYPACPTKESIRKGAEQHARYKKQTGGHGQFGDVKIRIAPLGRGEGFAFKNSIVGGSVPKQYIPSVEEGVKDFMRRGPLGFEVVDVAVELCDGSAQAVDSSDRAFKTAARMAMNEGLPKGKPVLLEPVLKVVISVPNDATARVQRIISGRRVRSSGGTYWPDRRSGGGRENRRGGGLTRCINEGVRPAFHWPGASFHDLLSSPGFLPDSLGRKLRTCFRTAALTPRSAMPSNGASRNAIISAAISRTGKSRTPRH